MRKFLKTLRNQKKPLIIFTDFDGCLTDDRVWLNATGEEFVAANRKDGLAIQRLNKIGIKVVIASTETNKVVKARGKKIKVEVLQGLEDKTKAIQDYLKLKKITWDQVWYIGNDLNDLGPIQKAGISLCPNDATREIKKHVDYKLKTNGGYGILSELVTYLESGKGKF